MKHNETCNLYGWYKDHIDFSNKKILDFGSEIDARGSKIDARETTLGPRVIFEFPRDKVRAPEGTLW